MLLAKRLKILYHYCYCWIIIVIDLRLIFHLTYVLLFSVASYINSYIWLLGWKVTRPLDYFYILYILLTNVRVQYSKSSIICIYPCTTIIGYNNAIHWLHNVFVSLKTGGIWTSISSFKYLLAIKNILVQFIIDYVLVLLWGCILVELRREIPSWIVATRS